MQSPAKPWETNNAMENKNLESIGLNTEISTPTSTTAPPPVPVRNENMGTGFNNYSSGYPNSYGGYNGYSGYNNGSYMGYGPNNYSNSYSMYNSYNSPFNSMGRRPLGEEFQGLDRFIQTITGFVHMIDSTINCTYSSYMSVMSAMEQFYHLKQYLGDIFSIIGMYQACKKYMTMSKEPEARQKQYRWLIFVCVITIPFILARLFKSKLEAVDPSKCPFAKALYSYQAQNPGDLSFNENDYIAILESNQNSGWWKGRLQDGKIGYFPSNYVQIIKRNKTIEE